MFESHIAFGVNLIAVVAAAGLLGFAAQTDTCGKALMKSIAYSVLVLGVLNILCTSYYTIRYWEDGYFKTPYNHSCPMMSGPGGMGMMQNGMMKGDMMKMMDKMGGMGGMKNQGGTPNPDEMKKSVTSDQEHKEHHPDQVK